MDENERKVYEVLQDAYEGCGIPDEELRGFAVDLSDEVFIDECRLNDIFCSVACFEEQMRMEDIEIDIGMQCAVYAGILNCLERNEMNAKRVYESYLEYRDISAFYDLMIDYAEWLTEEERAKVLEIAKVTFMEEIWKQYV